MFEEGMNLVVSPTSGIAYFKNNRGRLWSAPVDPATNIIDFREASMVDYFFLTQDEWEDAFNALSILEEDDEV